MSNEFRQIPQTPLYEIDKEGNVRKIKKQVPILPYPLGSRNVKLNINETTRQSFNVDELVEEIFGEKKESKEETLPRGRGTDFIGNLVADESSKEKWESERAKDTAQMPSSGKITVTKNKEEKKQKIKVEKIVKEKNIKVKKERKVSSDNPMIEKIMALKCYESIKMWKLHEIGINNADITILVNDPHDFVVVKTLEKYKKNETLRNRADKVKI